MIYFSYKAKYHSDNSQLKQCRNCGEFKDKDFFFTIARAICKDCRANLARNEYANSPEKRKYHCEYSLRTEKTKKFNEATFYNDIDNY